MCSYTVHELDQLRSHVIITDVDMCLVCCLISRAREVLKAVHLFGRPPSWLKMTDSSLILCHSNNGLPIYWRQCSQSRLSWDDCYSYAHAWRITKRLISGCMSKEGRCITKQSGSRYGDPRYIRFLTTSLKKAAIQLLFKNADKIHSKHQEIKTYDCRVIAISSLTIICRHWWVMSMGSFTLPS